MIWLLFLFDDLGLMHYNHDKKNKTIVNQMFLEAISNEDNS